MLAKFSVKKPYTVVVGILLSIILGVISFANMSTDLLPSMNMPYLVVYTTYIGATPEQVEVDVTRPMEASFATLSDIKNIRSTSSENLSLLIMEFDSGVDMDGAMIEVSSKIDMLRGEWSDSVGAPVVMKINPDMLPVLVASVSLDGSDIYELSDFVTGTLQPKLEAIDGVASVTVSGAVEQSVLITIDQNRIDIVNHLILQEIDQELAEVEQQLDEAQAQLSAGKRTLASEKSKVLDEIDGMLALIEGDAVSVALGQARTQREQVQAQLEQLRASIAAMEALTSLTPEQQQQLDAFNDRLASLRSRVETFQDELDALDAAQPDPDAQARHDEAVAHREELLVQREGYEQSIEDWTMEDPAALRREIAALEASIPTDEQALDSLKGELTQAQIALDTLDERIAALQARIDAVENPQAAASPSAGDTPASPEPSASTGDTAASFEPSASAGDTAATPEPSVSAGDTAASFEPSASAGGSEGSDKGSNAAVQGEDGARADEDASQGLLARLMGFESANAEEVPLEELRRQLAQAQQERSLAAEEVADLQARRDALEDALERDRERLTNYRDALERLEVAGDGQDTQDRVQEALRQIAALDAQIAQLDEDIARLNAALMPDEERAQRRAYLQEQIALLQASIAEIEDSHAYQMLLYASDEDAYNRQYAALSAARAQAEQALAGIDDAVAKLEQGVIPGGFIEGVDEDTDVEEARATLLSARSQALSAFSQAESQIRQADEEIGRARSEFYAQRDEALESAGLDGIITMEMVAGLIGAQNFSMPAGYVADGSGEEYLVRVGEEFSSLSELKRMKLFSLGMESIDEVRLLDVASVEIADNAHDVFTMINGEDGLMLSFQKQSNRSTADVAGEISQQLARLADDYEGLEFVELMNQGDYIDIVIDSVLDNLLYGAILAIAVLLIFLMDIRPTLIIALSIPVSVVIAFVAMYFSGITLNVLSLSGLALGIGMLVDNSIVAIENIYRLNIEENMSVLRACVVGAKQVSGALIASTLTTVCVFLPVVFVQGLTRDLFSDVGLTIAYSLLASLLVAMTVVPSMAATVLRRSRPHKERFEAVRRVYGRMLGAALRVKPLVLLVAVALLAFSAWQVMRMGMSFMPEVSSPQMTATLTFEDEMTDSQKQDASLALMDAILAVDGVDSVGMTSGNMMGIGGGEGMGQSMSFYIILDDAMERTNAEIGADILAAGEVTQLAVSVQTNSMDISMLSGEGISVEITGEDLDTLRQIAADIAEIAASLEGAQDVSDGLEQSVPELRVVVDKDRANDEGLSVAQVYQYLASRLADPQQITSVRIDGKDYPVELVEGRNLDLTAAQIADLEIEVSGAEEDKFVRVGDIATIEQSMSLTSIAREAQQRCVTVTFDAADGWKLSDLSRQFEEKLAQYTPPDGYGVALAGENETVMGIIRDMLLVIAVALAFIFLIMVAQFQSFKSPIIVMFTIPLAFTGGLLALIFTGMDLSVVSLVGFLLLSGVVVNNGIVFVDCINQLRIGGMEKREAILETGRLRLRPILMTALTTILGMSTMALGAGMGAEMMQPMAVVSIGGLIYATLMTLFVVPVLYDLVNGKKMKAREIEMIRESAGLRSDDELLSETRKS